MSAAAGDRNEGPWRLAQGAVLVLVAGFFLYSLRDLLNPFLLYWVVIALLVPFRGVRGHALVVTVATLLAGVWVLDTAGSLLAPFFLAFVLAYILDPVADRVSAHPRINRTAAIFLILVPALAAGSAALGFGVPEVVRQAGDLIAYLTEWVRGLNPADLGFDIPFVDEGRLLASLQSLDAETVGAFLEEHKATIARKAQETFLGLGRGVGALFTVLSYLVLTPVLMFYLLRDYDRIIARTDDLLPGRVREGARGFFREFDDLLSRYLRGQVATALLTGAITWVGLMIVGFPYAFVLGVTVAVLGVVPYLGVVVSLIPAVILALISEDIGMSLLKVGVVYGVAQGLESAVISPRIVGESVGLHPVWILLALSLGGFFFGFVGLLIGVPLAVAVKLLLVRTLERYRESALYKEEAAT
ncbi:MAG: AI-2E family transporter [Gemmatimonadota bacterium]|nr:AI-2E family transporter [Gemmatimonadota bacterium]MDE2985886.1 AI-2E family transporter [Gemmatimonadota bacterium]